MAISARNRLGWGRIALQGVLGGIAGAILLQLLLWLTLDLPAHVPIAARWTAMATDALGKGLAAQPHVAWLGLGIYLVVSLVWGVAYAYLAATRPFMNARWLLSGLAYGLCVYIVMQIVVLVSGAFQYPHTPNDFVFAVLAHIIFFGVPVALVVKWLAPAE